MVQATFQVSIFSSLACGFFISFSPVSAQIVSDTTLPTQSQVRGCPVCLIEGGTVRGVHLFHSFEEFSVQTGGEAFFNNALPIETIFSRVTGSKISDIDGLIRANGTVNIFLINPNGILFGQNAQLNIGGSFVASTANKFTFPDGSEFSATNPLAPPLLTMTITPGLQWGTLPVGDITNRGNLEVESGQTLALSGNQVTSTGSLTAPGGTITLTSRGDMITGFMRSFSSAGDGGIITLSAGGDITTEYLNSFSSRGNGGDITITAGGN
ncbi:filamentous hemagglutinin N-terminal domain-containing protein, partial [Coleofasciculus sp.]